MRYNRVIYVHAGLNAICIKELKQPAMISFNLFAAPKMFVPNSTEPRDINMMLSVGYEDIGLPAASRWPGPTRNCSGAERA